MGLGGILQELKTEGVLALYHDYRSGRLYDWSDNGRNGVASTGSIFNKQGVKFINAADVITVAASTSLALTQGSFVWLLRGGNIPTNAAYIHGKEGATTRYLLYTDNGTRLRFYNVASNITVNTDVSDARSFGVSFVNGGTPVGYRDGISLGNFSGTITLTGTSIDLEIGNYTSTYKLNALLKAVVICRRPLTATEHARLYGQLENMRWETKGLTPGPMIP